MRTTRFPSTIVVIAMLTYTVILCTACHSKYLALEYDDFDLAVHSQSVWNITRGSGNCSILGIPFLGNHMVLILFALAPLYPVFSSPLLLLHCQTLVLAAGAWGVYLMGRKELGPRWGAGLAVAYLVYPPLILMNLYEFHPIALAATFLVYAIYFLKTDRFRLYMLTLALAMLCQENVSLIAVFLGLYALVCRKPRKWILVPAGVGIAFFVIVVGFITPALNGNTVQFLRIYSHLAGEPGGNASAGAVVAGMLAHPLRTLRHCAHPLKLNFLNSLMAPLGYLSLAGPLALIPALPVLAQRLLSDRVSEAMIVYHYQAELIPFVFAAAISGIRNLRKLKRKLVNICAVLLLAAFPLLALITSGVVPAVAEAVTANSRQSPVTREAGEVIADIPDNACVAATFQFLPRLANRKELHSLHHIYHGRHTLSDVPYPPPDNVDYVVMDTNDRMTFLDGAFYNRDAYRNIRAVLGTSRWELVSQLDSFLALRRSSDDGPPLELVSEAPPDVTMNTNVTCTTGEAIEVVGFQAHAADGGRLPISLFWKKPVADDSDYEMHMKVCARHATRDTQYVLFSGMLSPGSRISPPQGWEPGKVIRTEHHVYAGNDGNLKELHVSVELIPR